MNSQWGVLLFPGASGGFWGASGGFPQVIIHDRRCHRFWSVDEDASPLLCSEAFPAPEFAFKHVSVRQPCLNVKPGEEVMCRTGASVLLTHECRLRGL